MTDGLSRKGPPFSPSRVKELGYVSLKGQTVPATGVLHIGRIKQAQQSRQDLDSLSRRVLLAAIAALSGEMVPDRIYVHFLLEEGVYKANIRQELSANLQCCLFGWEKASCGGW